MLHTGFEIIYFNQDEVFKEHVLTSKLVKEKYEISNAWSVGGEIILFTNSGLGVWSINEPDSIHIIPFNSRENYRVNKGILLNDSEAIIPISRNGIWQFNIKEKRFVKRIIDNNICLLYTSPSPRDATLSRMPSSA